MRLKILAVTLAAAMAIPGLAGAVSFEVPLDAAKARELAKILAADQAFANAFMIELSKKLEKSMSKPPIDGMAKGPSGGMLPDGAAEAGKRENGRQAGPNMSEGGIGGMQKGPEVPATTAREPEGFKLRPKSQLLERKIQPAVTGAKDVELFISLTCPYCWELWTALRADPVSRDHLLEDMVSVNIMPQSDTEAAVCLVHEYVNAQDPEKAMEFIDWFGSRRQDFFNKDSAILFSAMEEWLGRNGLGSIKDIQSDKSLTEALGARIQSYIDKAESLGVTSYPSIYADGRKDREYFTKVIEATGRARAGAQADGGAK